MSIAPDAVIAAGSILKADSGCSIVIGSGVCLGLGSVLHANGGDITVEAGASLGAGTVVVGSCRIGTQACVGTSTTIYNVSVAPSQLVPPASLLGNAGRSVEPETSASTDSPREANQSSEEVDSATDKRNSEEASIPKAAKMEVEPSPWDEVESDSSAEPASPSSSSAPKKPRAKTVVYGMAQFEQMRGAMFSRNRDI